MVSDKKNLSVTEKIFCERIDKYFIETQMEILKNIQFIVLKKIVKL